MTLGDIILSFFRIHGRETSRWRDTKTGRFVSAPIWRVTVAMNYVIQKKYYGAIIQEWVRGAEPDKHGDLVRDMKADLIRMVESEIGYDESEWWFTSRIGVGVQQVTTENNRYESIERKA